MHRIDANITLRYLLDDHKEHSALAADIIEKNTVAVSTEVICEVMYSGFLKRALPSYIIL